MAKRLSVHAKYCLGYLTFLLLVAGCSGNRSVDANVMADAQSAFDSALEEIDAGNVENAIEHLNVALAPGAGLPPDIYVEARIQRAICLARKEDFQAAHEDLDAASEGAGDMSSVHVARSFVYDKEGKNKEARSEMTAAKKLNRRAKAIK